MKRFALSIIALLIFSVAQAQLLGSLTTRMQGGVKGKTQDLTFQIGFHEVGTDLMNETMIFENLLVTADSETAVYALTAKSETENYAKFIEYLTAENAATLKIGHKINNINNHIGRSVEDWFGTSLSGKEIGKIELIITKVDFATPGTNRLSDGNWTDFFYEITINVYGKDELVVQN